MYLSDHLPCFNLIWNQNTPRQIPRYVTCIMNNCVVDNIMNHLKYIAWNAVLKNMDANQDSTKCIYIYIHCYSRYNLADFCQANTAFSYRFCKRKNYFCWGTKTLYAYKTFCTRTNPFVREHNLLYMYKTFVRFQKEA